MKRTLFIGAALVASLNVLAQGTVNFANNNSSRITNNVTGAPMPVGTTFWLALYWAPDALETPADSAFVQIGPPCGQIVLPGRFSGGTQTTGPETPPGGPAWFWVKGWEAYQGSWGVFSDFESATDPVRIINGRMPLAGTSAKFRLAATGDGFLRPPAHIFPPDGGFTGLILVPEPSVLGLALPGLALLLWLRRRKPPQP